MAGAPLPFFGGLPLGRGALSTGYLRGLPRPRFTGATPSKDDESVASEIAGFADDVVLWVVAWGIFFFAMVSAKGSAGYGSNDGA